MKVLLVLSSFFPFGNANTNVALPFVDRLKEFAQIDVLCARETPESTPFEQHDGVNIYRYDFASRPFSFVENDILSGHAERSIQSVIKRFLALLLKPIFYLMCRKRFQTTQIPTIHNLIKKEKYDAVVSVTSSFSNVMLVYTARKTLKQQGTKWYQLVEDPYSEYIFHVLSGERNYMRKQERKCYRFTDRIFILKSILSNSNDVVHEFSEKIVPINFPTFSVQKKSLKPLVSDFGKQNINLVYMGSLQCLDIRNPEYMFQIIRALPECNLHIHCYIYSWDSDNRDLAKNLLPDNPHITFYPRVSLDESHRIIQAADVLINIGNRANNQVPSKILDYLSLGKPIVNFCNLSDDTSYDIMKDYPLLLNLNENDISVEEAAERLVEFCTKNYGNFVFPDVLETLLSEYTPEKATDQFASIVRNLQ